MTIRSLFVRDPSREITSFIRITEHDPRKVWAEMDEYFPTKRVKTFFHDVLDALLDTRQGTTERVCIWINGFFGSGKSHFLKTLGYLLKDYPLEDRDGHQHSSRNFLGHKLDLGSVIPLLSNEFENQVIFINLLDQDPQSPTRPTISRLVYRGHLTQSGLSVEFWVAAWEKELMSLGKWAEFQDWVKQNYGRDWQQERRLNAEVILKRALPILLVDRYQSEEEATQAIQESKLHYSTVNPSDVVEALRHKALSLDPVKGRVILLLDEVGLYIGDSIERLTDLNALAEQVVQAGQGRVLLLVTAQEALTDLVPRLTADRQILEWLRDRFRLRLSLEPTEVQTVVGNRLLAKTPEGADQLRNLFRSHQGNLLGNLSLDRNWGEEDFISQYPLPPYAVVLMQDIMGAMRGSVEEARRLAGSERSMLKITQALLIGEGGMTVGADQPVGWLASLDAFFDALSPDLMTVRGEQVRAIEEMAELGDIQGLHVKRVAKALFLLQQVGRRYPTSIENITAALVDRVDQDINSLQEVAKEALDRLYTAGWVVPEEGKYRLLTREEHDLESEVRRNWPDPAELIDKGTFPLLKDMLSQFRYEHGAIRRPLKVAFILDGTPYLEEGELLVELYSPLSDADENQILGESIAESQKIFWMAAESPEIRGALERVIAVQKTLEQLGKRTLTPMQQEHRDRLERETQTTRLTRLPQLMRQAFMSGQIYQAGEVITPNGNDLASALRTQLRTIAQVLFYEFVDARPERDDDCAAILTWAPGTILPPIFANLTLITASSEILHDARLPALIKGEILRRENLGLDRSGKELAEHFSRSPYGWDPRLIRMLFATLVKAGKLGLNYQNRDFADPTDPQIRMLFVNQREFQRVMFSILPDVDWRAASRLCSSLFSVQGGDTFERTAAIVQQQSASWGQEALQLSTRCGDNALPSHFSSDCQKAAQLLQDIARVQEPNARLRRALEKGAELQPCMARVRKLKVFNFERYRIIRNFSEQTLEWPSGSGEEAQRRWQNLRANLDAQDLLDRFEPLNADYAYLLNRFRQDYEERHREFQEAIGIALNVLQTHPAFDTAPEQSDQALQPLRDLRCDMETPIAEEETLRCSSCQRSYNQLSGYLVDGVRHEIEMALEDLLPPMAPGPVQPWEHEAVLHNEQEVNILASEMQRYLRRANQPIEVHLDAKPAEGEN
jgi:hypothetical protein